MPHKRAKRSIRLAETAKKGSNLAPSSSTLYDDTPRSASRILNGWATQSAFRASGRVTSEDTGERRAKPKAVEAGSNLSKGKGKATEGKGAFNVPSILPHETLGEYNRRVESLLRPEVNKAIKDAESIKAAEAAQAWKDKKERKKRAKLEKLVKEGKLDKSALEEGAGNKRKRDAGSDVDEEEEEGTIKPNRPAKEFAALPGPKRLNDIVQAPPTLPHLRKSGQEKKVGKGVYSAVGNSGKNPLNLGQRRIMEEERERVVKLYREMKEKGVVGKGVDIAKGQ